jgi:hypothetical protein
MAEHLCRRGALNGAGEAQFRGRAGLLEAPAKKSGNLPGHSRDAIAFRPPDCPRKVTTGAKQEGVAMRHLLLAVPAILLWLAPTCGEAQDGGNKTQRAAVAVIDFDYVDTSGEARDQRGEHEARLAVFMRALKEDLAQGDRFRPVTPTCAPSPCSLASSMVTGLLAAAREAGADILLIGGVHKMSTLVQWAKIEAIDAKTERVLFDKLFTFRGDTDDAWRRAEVFIVEEITAVSGQPASR